MQSNNKTVIQAIQENYNIFFSAEKKVADFILKNPEKVLDLNVSELAKLSEVSEATVVRFCQHVGYKGYYQMRIYLSKEVGASQGKRDNIILNDVEKLFQEFISTIQTIGNNISPKQMVECANLIRGCGQAHIVAVGNTSALAQYLGFRLGRTGIRCTYNLVPEYFINQINLSHPDDIVIAISKSGSSRQVIQALELAKKRDIRSIGITGHKLSPMTSLTDYVLVSDCENTGNKSYSHLGEMAVLDALIFYVHCLENYETEQIDFEIPEMIFSEYKI